MTTKVIKSPSDEAIITLMLSGFIPNLYVRITVITIIKLIINDANDAVNVTDNSNSNIVSIEN